VEDNTSFMQDFKPLNHDEQTRVEQAAQIINRSIAIPCTACHYCTDGCPQEICIPEYFYIYNNLCQFGRKEQWNNTSVYYGVLNKTHGKASDCIECGQCEEHCPQHIHIIDNLKLVAKTFE
jgi:predicted aldo/keto reductase-like oxidoreductase